MSAALAALEPGADLLSETPAVAAWLARARWFIGLWTAAYRARSALPLAAALGWIRGKLGIETRIE